MKLNLELLKGIVTMYGTPLYSSTPETVAGTVVAGEYTIVDNTLVIETEAGTMYIPIRTSRVDAGIDETQSFTIGSFSALRDASGDYNGKAWSVKQGEAKAFAY